MIVGFVKRCSSPNRIWHRDENKYANIPKRRVNTLILPQAVTMPLIHYRSLMRLQIHGSLALPAIALDWVHFIAKLMMTHKSGSLCSLEYLPSTLCFLSWLTFTTLN